MKEGDNYLLSRYTGTISFNTDVYKNKNKKKTKKNKERKRERKRIINRKKSNNKKNISYKKKREIWGNRNKFWIGARF